MFRFAALFVAILIWSASAQATVWCMWPARPDMPPHPCAYGGVRVAPNLGYWWGDAWVWGPWRPWGAGPVIRVVPRWGRHNWDRDRDWR